LFLKLGGKRQGSREGISQVKKDKTEDARYEYNISSLGKIVTAGMNGNKYNSKRAWTEIFALSALDCRHSLLKL
jgi:hypothetical protein